MSEQMQSSNSVSGQGSNFSQKNTNSKNKGLAFLVIGIVVLVAVAAFLVVSILSSSQTSNEWSAVSLTNGRTYFGQIEKETSDKVILENVYYLQVNQVQDQEGQNQPQISLQNIQNEMHGPTDRMEINRDHVLFVEKLSNNSQILAALKQQAAGAGLQQGAGMQQMQQQMPQQNPQANPANPQQ